MDVIVLGIETSCDETAASLVRGGREVLSNVVSSQVDLHGRYGGVIPELASRMHTQAIIPVIEEALVCAGASLEDVGAIAVTAGPGLIGCLMVGVAAAKSIAYGLSVPLIGVDHLEAHIAASYIEYDVSFPFVGLVASGGHTSLYLVTDYTEFELLGKTRDDAAGEAFDKGAKILGLGYPGGVEIDRIARGGDRKAIEFPRPFLNASSWDFSFSGLKTALAYYLRRLETLDEKRLADICASYQEAIVETLVAKTLFAAKEYGVSQVVISGGVASNSRLREMAVERFGSEGIRLFIPSPKYCTDNAAMVAALGYYRLARGERSDLELNAYSTQRPKYLRGRGLIAE
jgi:N6-L-threonylcarbamoyladenine synthase